MQALDCKMHHDMKVVEHSNPVATFVHQMIPHHQNAVNMAKVLLKFGPGAAGYEDEDFDMHSMLPDIVNSQNMQIVTMQKWMSKYQAWPF